MNLSKLTLLSFLFLSLQPLLIFAAENDKESVVLSKPIKQEVVIETMYQYFVRDYENEVIFDPKKTDYKKFNVSMSPDLATINILSSLSKGDMDVFKSYMSESYKEIYSGLDHISEFSRTISKHDRFVRLTQRVDIGPIMQKDRKGSAIIHYEVFDNNSKDKILLEGDMHFENNRGWRLIHDKDDVIYRNWKFDGLKKIIEVEQD